ncbi:MAG: methyl-accepting chemotaxis protein, partial [Planctomycetota bacterium]|nr:methyl-accepting chemotaxis protein [Planctomycetota bacterium]
VTRVKNGSEIASKLDSSFKEIQEGSNIVGSLITEITSATNEQAQGVDQVNTAVAQMDKVTQQNAATAEESASAAEELSAQAANLNDMVSDLVSLVRGGSSKGGNNNQESSGNHSRSNGGPTPVRAKIATRGGRRAPGTPPTSSKEGNKEGVKMLPASEVIPLGEGDDDF